MEAGSPGSLRPTLLMRISMRPSWLMQASTNAFMDDEDVASACTTVTEASGESARMMCFELLADSRDMSQPKIMAP